MYNYEVADDGKVMKSPINRRQMSRSASYNNSEEVDDPGLNPLTRDNSVAERSTSYATLL